MIEHLKPVESLTAADFHCHPVWAFTNRDGAGETFVRALKRLPVKSLDGKVVGTQLRLANGTQVWAMIGNLDASNPQWTEHFITLSIERQGEWFHLARYHDYDAAARGPEALARFLDLKVEDVFPIFYDVRKYVKGDSAALIGSVQKEPKVRLSRAEIIALAIPPPGGNDFD